MNGLNEDTILGIAVIGIPLLLAGYLLLRKYAAVLWFYIAALLVGLGYLTSTGSVNEIGAKVRAATPQAPMPLKTPESSAPAPATAPAPPPAAPEPAPAAPAPAPEAAPAPPSTSGEPAPFDPAAPAPSPAP